MRSSWMHGNIVLERPNKKESIVHNKETLERVHLGEAMLNKKQNAQRREPGLKWYAIADSKLDGVYV